MALNWIDVNEFSFNCMLMFERFQIRLMFAGTRSEEWRRNMGVALRGNPAVAWYFMNKCPECADAVRNVVEGAPAVSGADEIRKAEMCAMDSVEDFVTYTRPEVMDASCDFIYGWDKARLFELADFTDKVVLDVGSGSGRLAFAAAEKTKMVYASEPVDSLREYLRDKIARESIKNVRVVDGMAHCLAYPDDTFDIVMSGHVMGDDYDAEIAEMSRVLKSGGWFLDCPGEDSRKTPPSPEMVAKGWEELHYESVLGGDVYRYRKQIIK